MGNRFSNVITLVERQDDEYAACVLEPKGLDLFGVGSSALEAVEDLKATINEAYQMLNEERGNLGPKLEVELRILETFMQPKRAPSNVQKNLTTTRMSVRGGNNRAETPHQGYQNYSAVGV